MLPEVSILVITFNRVELSAQYIPMFLERAGNVNTELLIWDNGSIDGSFDWGYTYSKADCRVHKVVGSNKNIGVEATTHLAKIARGKYIIKLDDDIEVPNRYAERLVSAYKQLQNDKVLFISWDMPWTDNTFAKRSGMSLYKPPNGEIVNLLDHSRLLISHRLDRWLINGACRFSPRDKFLEIGGHPKGIIYGVDEKISKIAHNHGYHGAYLSTKDLIMHRGTIDTPAYRRMKNNELARIGSPLHV